MRHNKNFNHLGRQAGHRKAMLSNMASSLILHKRIETTVAKAKAVKQFVEPLVTKSKEDTTHSRRIVFSYLKQKEAVTELFRTIAPKIADRPGGYTRVSKLGFRRGDAAPIAFIELVDFDENMAKAPKAAKKTRRSRRSSAAKTTEAAAPVAAAATGLKADWSKLAEVFKAKGANLTVNGDTVAVTGEVDAATKASLLDQVKALFGADVKIDDKLMIKGATASEGATLLKVEFATGSSEITAAAKTELDAFAAELKKSGKKGEIGGHTDNVGDAAKNVALSDARAKAVVAYLVKQGVAADALTAKGYGDASPIADNTKDDGRARNRRVEFK